MRFGTMIAVAGVVTLLGAGASQATPLTVPPLATTAHAMPQPALDAGPAPQIELVRGGCGFGAHRSYLGRCHNNYGWRGRARAWRRG